MSTILEESINFDYEKKKIDGNSGKMIFVEKLFLKVDEIQKSVSSVGLLISL